MDFFAAVDVGTAAAAGAVVAITGLLGTLFTLFVKDMGRREDNAAALNAKMLARAEAERERVSSEKDAEIVRLRLELAAEEAECRASKDRYMDRIRELEDKLLDKGDKP